MTSRGSIPIFSPTETLMRLNPPMSSVFLVLAVALTAAGCGGGGGGATGATGSCEHKGGLNHACSDYAADFPNAATACTMSGGTVVASCSMANVVGSCSLSISGFSEVVYYYSDMMISTMAVQTSCTAQGGTWTPG
jgi:hypothetical protein